MFTVLLTAGGNGGKSLSPFGVKVAVKNWSPFIPTAASGGPKPGTYNLL